LEIGATELKMIKLLLSHAQWPLNVVLQSYFFFKNGKSNIWKAGLMDSTFNQHFDLKVNIYTI